MVRHVTAFALVAWFIPTWLCAQTAQFTVTVESAAVYKAPSTGSPVIGNAPRGRVLQVERNLGSWVKVPWTGAEDGFAYVHVTMGSLTNVPTPNPGHVEGPVVDRPVVQTAPTLTATRRDDPLRASEGQPELPQITYIPAPTHALGLGGRVGVSHPGLGGSARLWSRNRLGFQLEVSRDVLTNVGVSERLTSVQIAPSVLYSLRDRVSDYISVRPYVGAGAGVLRQTFHSGAPGVDRVSDNSLCVQAAGGSEATFSSVPQFGLSAELAYRRVKRPFSGFDAGGLVVSVFGHWYVR